MSMCGTYICACDVYLCVHMCVCCVCVCMCTCVCLEYVVYVHLHAVCGCAVYYVSFVHGMYVCTGLSINMFLLKEKSLQILSLSIHAPLCFRVIFLKRKAELSLSLLKKKKKRKEKEKKNMAPQSLERAIEGRPFSAWPQGAFPALLRQRE